MICFVIALNGEAEPVIANMTEVKETIEYDKRVVRGKIDGVATAIIVCNVGKVNAATATQYAIDRLGADAIINTGTAGGLNDGLQVANIYGISHAVQYDFDLVQLNGTTIGTLNEYNEAYLPISTVDGLPLKKLATGDRFNDDKKDYLLLTNELKADVRDMEGGAIAQVCRHANVPFYSFKVISDIAGSGSTTEQFLSNLALCGKAVEKNIKAIFRSVYEKNTVVL